MNFLQRLAARFFFGTTSVFEGANRSPRRATVPGSGPQDAALDLSPGVRSELVRRSRYLVKNSGFLREIVGSMALYSIGDGILPQPASKDSAWNEQALACFNRWARHADISGRFNLIQCEHLACKALDVDGEIFILKTMENGEPKIQLIESHRIGSKEENWTEVDFVTPETVTEYVRDDMVEAARLRGVELGDMETSSESWKEVFEAMEKLLE